VQSIPIESIPPFLAGLYVSRSSLEAADRAQLVATLRDARVKQKYWNAVLNSHPRPWAIAGAKLAD
jgi:hypothetical protein